MKIKLGVFFGGKSVEHEVSIITALQAIRSLDHEKYDIVPVYIDKNNCMHTGFMTGRIESYSDIPALIRQSVRVNLVRDGDRVYLVRYPARFGKKIISEIDIAFPMGHGTNVEDGVLQGLLQFCGVPYVGCDVFGAACGMNKYAQKILLMRDEIPVLNCVKIKNTDYLSDSKAVIKSIDDNIGFPVVIKPLNLGSSVGIKIAKTLSEVEEALEYAFLFSNEVLAEYAILNLREINVSVLGDKDNAQASECEEPIASSEILSYDDKYLSGNKNSKNAGMASLSRKIPADISPELKQKIQTLAVKAFKSLGCCGVARIDFLLDTSNNDLYFNEINTLPGSLAFYLWEPVGLKYPQLLDKMIELALKRERANKLINFSFESNILAGASLGGLKGGKV